MVNVGERSPLPLAGAATLASPKSSTFTVPSGLILMLAGFQRVGDLMRDAQRFLQRHRPLRRFALNVLHHQVIRAHIMQRADIRMIQRGHRPRLQLEALGKPFVRDLDRDNSLQPRVASLVDFAHPARADALDNLVRSQAVARGKSHKLDL